MKRKESLQTFLKDTASHTCLCKGKGHEKGGTTADILQNKALRIYPLREKAYETKGIAADIPKN